MKFKLTSPSHECIPQFDLERPFTAEELAGGPVALAATRLATVKAFLRRLQVFLRCVADDGQHLELVPGKNCQVCESVYNDEKDDKFSTHVVVYADGATWELSSKVAHTLEAILVCLPPSDADFPLLVYTDRDDATTSIIDLDIYGNGRCFRMLYNCKLKRPSPLLPILGSSTRVRDHLVNAYPELQPPTGIDGGDDLVRLDPNAVVRHAASLAVSLVAPDAGSSVQGELLRRLRPSGGGTSQAGQAVVANWHTRELDDVRTMLLGHAGLAAELRIPAVSFEREYTLSRNLMRFQISQAAGPRCPYAGRVHSGNHCFMQYDHALQLCTLGCYDEACKGRLSRGEVEEIQLHVPAASRRAAITAAIDVTQQRDLHTRQHLVRWAEVYDEREMRPYPLDERLILVRANMGAGELFCAVQFRAMNPIAWFVTVIHPPCDVVGKTKALVKHLQRKDQQASPPSAGKQLPVNCNSLGGVLHFTAPPPSFHPASTQLPAP